MLPDVVTILVGLLVVAFIFCAIKAGLPLLKSVLTLAVLAAICYWLGTATGAALL